ncbi:MAG TPA: MOSC N-terminal beta barrel domain-containing protein [Gemmatimonadales bacterium]|nr:MOSC N-terminal beta barrel domain-containing protein [Gemmatimonadales bacterium]
MDSSIAASLRVAELWRYPVKSMAGQRLEQVELDDKGFAGDRIVYVRGPAGRVLTARTRPTLLGHRGTLGADGQPLVDGRPWRSADVAADVVRAAGDGATLAYYDGISRFDQLPLLVATDGAIRALGEDGRRLRPNLVIGGVAGLDERSWEGRTLRIGGALVGARDLRARCIMTTFDPDTLVQNTEVLERIRREFEGRLALNCFVIRGGTIAVGDEVTLCDTNS